MREIKFRGRISEGLENSVCASMCQIAQEYISNMQSVVDRREERLEVKDANS
jgi:hypothetical protein